MIITIDGPAGTGKGTLARRVADYYRMAYFDTGMVYRAVWLKMHLSHMDISDESLAESIAQNLTYDEMIKLSKHPEFRGPESGLQTSIVASHPKVRLALLQMQRDFAKKAGNGVVYDGRDIGTVVIPDADIKFFVTASPEVRAERRFREFQEKGIVVDYADVLENIKQRDDNDRNRKISPLKPANEAIIIDTSSLNADEVFEKTKEYIGERA